MDLQRSLGQAQNELQEEQNKKNALIEDLNKEVLEFILTEQYIFFL